jgi:nitrite reductase/ring-hydroxylating ferredoxin subunit
MKATQTMQAAPCMQAPKATPPHWSTLPHAPAPGTPLALRDDLVDGTPTMLSLDTDGGPDKPFRLLLLRSALDVRAFVNRCAHFGVPLAAKQAQLIFKPHTSITCNVHYARYRWADGSCESGECEGEGLVAVPLQIDANGQICIALQDESESENSSGGGGGGNVSTAGAAGPMERPSA